MLTLTFTSVGHPECVLSTARWRLRRASTRRVGPLFRRGGSPELRAPSLVGSWGAHRLSTRWNMSTDNRLAEPPGDRNTASTGSPLWRIPERRASGNSAFSRRRFSAHGSPIVRSQPQLVSRSTNEKCSPTPPLDATRPGGHGGEGQVVAIATDGVPRHRWRPRMPSCPNREASQVCPIHGSRHGESLRSTRSCGSIGHQTCVRGRPRHCRCRS